MSVVKTLIAKRDELDKQIMFAMRHEHLHDLCELLNMVADGTVTGRKPLKAVIEAMIGRIDQ